MLTEKRLYRIIDKLNLIIKRLLYWGWCDSAIAYAKCLANLYYIFGVKYVDLMLEHCVKILSDKIVLSSSNNKDEYTCVFYDDFSIDNRGLTQQYVESLIALGYRVTYIYIAKSKNNKQLIKVLCHSQNQIVPIDANRNGMQLAQQIYDIVHSSGAKHLFVQMSPYSVEANIAFCALDKTINRYNINLTDHAYNIGITHMDYNLEFRNFGAYVSVKYRGVQKEKEILLPMHPVLNTTVPFQGYPQACENKVVILTGGAVYKIMDESETFFKLIQEIVTKNQNVLVMYVGCQDKRWLEDRLVQYGLNRDVVVVVGNRKDIYEVINHCDIYMNTYPIGGGLMCQIAAHCGKPVVNYQANTRMEECICQCGNVTMSYNTIEEFSQEVTRLIEDEQYRMHRGEIFRDSVISSSYFQKLLGDLLKNGKGGAPIDFSKTYEKESIVDMSSAIIRENQNMIFHKYMCKTLGYRIILFPFILCRTIWSVIKN